MGLFRKKDFFALGVKAYQKGDILKAIKNWEKAVKQGNATAQYNIGICYENGDGIGRDQKKAFELFLAAAQEGHKESQYKVGTYYAEAIAVPRDIANAVEWLKKAAEQEDEGARARLDSLKREMDDGTLAKKLLENAKKEEQENHFQEAFQDYEQAAGLGDARAQYELGRIYNEGRLVEKKLEKSMEWCEKSARQGFVQAQIALGKFYEAGIGCAKDKEAAACWYQKAAEQGNADAQYRLAIILSYQGDWEENIGQIISLMEKASNQGHEKAKASEGKYRELCELIEKARQGDTDAQIRVADMYDKSDRANKEERKAYWYGQAVERGSARAAFYLGVMYRNGVGVERNKDTAIELYKKAAQEGIWEAQFNLANIYREEKNFGEYRNEIMALCTSAAESGDEEAKDLYERFIKFNEIWEKAEKEDAEACDTLSMCYQEGIFVSKNDHEAVKWQKKALRLYEKAAKEGEAYAQFWMGEHEQRLGEIQKAFLWYQKAADQGEKYSQFRLGVMYHNGTGVVEDEDNALCWLLKSAEQGVAEAQYNAGLIYLGMRNMEGNKEKAEYWLTKAVKQGDKEAGFELAELMLQQEDIESCISEAVFLMEQASESNIPEAKERLISLKNIQNTIQKAKEGNADCEYNLGTMYESGETIAQNDRRAFEWYLKAAEHGHSKAAGKVGNIYFDGRSGSVEKRSAIEWWKKGAEKGDRECQYQLGMQYLRGCEPFIWSDHDEAVMWLQKAAIQGDGRAYLAIGEYEKAAEMGNAEGQYRLGSKKIRYYKENKHKFCTDSSSAKMRKDSLITGIDYLERSAKQGYAPAQYDLAILYLEERGNTMDLILKVPELLERAAKQGYESAERKIKELGKEDDFSVWKSLDMLAFLQNVGKESKVEKIIKDPDGMKALSAELLAEHYRDGKFGLPKDEFYSWKWTEKAAEWGDAIAQYNVGVHYYNMYVRFEDYKHYEEAGKWLGKAASQGVKKAQELLEKLESF